MIKVNHISMEQLPKMIGAELTSELWLNGMFNEIRRYPNEIPCVQGEIPSMIIPRSSGPEKVEWGFAAGMSCLIQDDSGEILVRHAGHFPACACLALLSVLADAGADRGRQLSVTLRVQDWDDASTFRTYIDGIAGTLKNVSINIKPDKSDKEQIKEEPRMVLDLKNSIAVVHQLQQVDIGRFAAVVQIVNGSFSTGDDITIADGEFKELQTHCPILMISDKDGMSKVANNTDEIGDVCMLMFAMWFPPGTEFDRMHLVKEAEVQAFTPEKMPERPVIAGAVEPGEPKGFFKRLFG